MTLVKLWEAIVGTGPGPDAGTGAGNSAGPGLGNRAGTMVSFQPGAYLVRYGEVGSHCYAIVEGEVVVTATTKQGSTVVLRREGPGSVIGDLAALDGGLRSATVIARSEVRAVALSAPEFQSLLRDDPDLALSELQRLAAQVTSLTERILIRGEDLQSRISQILLVNMDASGDPAFRSTRQELADWVGATREAVSRSLKEMEQRGLVRLGRGMVEVLDRDGLTRLG